MSHSGRPWPFLPSVPFTGISSNIIMDVRNVSGRLEYHYGIFSKLFGGNRRRACMFNAGIIFGLTLLRDYAYHRALDDCHASYSLRSMNIVYFGYAMLAMGAVFVASAYYRLGIVGTYLGDHFGILMDKKVEGFPFNVLAHPMYEGASMIFMGWGLVKRKISGLVLSMWAYSVYMLMAKTFEEPFTNHIYNTSKKKSTAAVEKNKSE